MKPELFEALVEECKAAVEVSKTEGQAAINATERMIEGLTNVICRHDKSFDYKKFYFLVMGPMGE